jgi:RNA polymerase sigma-70 factor (ECF subfamily)
MSTNPNDKRTRFEETAIPFLAAVHGMARRLTRNAEDARELAQETYLRAYRTFENFRPGTNCKAWLLTILYSVFVNRYRKARREPRTVSVEELEERFQATAEAETAPERAGAPPQWNDREVEEAFGLLPNDFRAVVLLVDVEELSYEEAAAALDCPIGTVRSRLFRARKLLAAALKDYARRAGYGKGERKGP